MGDGYTNEYMQAGTAAHELKENELSGEWDNEVRLAYKIADGYYITGTIDRYHKVGIIEDFKTTKKQADSYLDTNQIEVYAFLAVNNDMSVESGRYTTIDQDGNVLTTADVPINEDIINDCYVNFILRKFNMIQPEIEKLRVKYTIVENGVLC